MSFFPLNEIRTDSMKETLFLLENDPYSTVELRGQNGRDCWVPANPPNLLTRIDSKSETILEPNIDVREGRKAGRKEV
jgi:hypothetical protein